MPIGLWPRASALPGQYRETAPAALETYFAAAQQPDAREACTPPASGLSTRGRSRTSFSGHVPIAPVDARECCYRVKATAADLALRSEPGRCVEVSVVSFLVSNQVLQKPI